MNEPGPTTSPKPSGPEPAPPDRRDELGRVRRWWLDVPVVGKGIAVVALPLAVLVPALVLAGILGLRQPDVRADAVEAASIARGARQALQLLTDAETGLRGYAATDDRTFLEPYERAVERLPTELDSLEQEAGDELAHLTGPVRAEVTDTLDALAAAEQAVIEREPGDEAVIDQLVVADDAMDEARAAVAELTEEVDAEVAAGRDEIDDLARLQVATIVIGLVLGAAAGVAGAVLATRDIARRVGRVAERGERFIRGEVIEAEPRGRDEIGQMEDRLIAAADLIEEQHALVLASRDQAMQATLAKDEFLSRMSHELRTPLTAVIGFGQLLQLSELSDDDRESADLVVKAGRHLLDLINEVLDISRIETGNLSLSLEPLPLHDLVAEATHLMAPSARATGVSIEARCDPQACVLADHRRLTQVVLNLVSNAVKYNHDGGRVTITTSTDSPRVVRLALTDTGPGIAEDDLDRVFAPFDRLDATAGEVEGTGVGLALSKALTEAMGGTIGVESEPGVGSTFWIELLRATLAPEDADDTAGGVEPAAHPPARPDTDAIDTVLYIEDNAASSQLMERLYRDRPEALEVASRGEVGLQIAAQRQPRLILLDLHLPDLPGEEVLTRLQAAAPTRDIPVVVISADASPRRSREVAELGAAAFVTKPVDVPALVALLDELSRQASARRPPQDPR